MRRSMHRELLLCLSLLSAAACDDDLPRTTPTTPTPPPVVENFSGTLNQNGAATYTFTVASRGTVTATLLTVSPDSTVRMGLSLGTWNGTSCAIIVAKDDAVQGAIVTGAVSSAGTLCLRIHDVGSIAQPTSYEVQVSHP